MLLTSQRDTKNRIVKNAQMLLSAVVKLIFFLFKNIFQYLVHAPFFPKFKKNTPTFCNPTRNSLYISSVFTIKNVFKNGLYWQNDKVHISKIKLISARFLVRWPMLLNVYLNKSKKRKEKLKVKEIIEKIKKKQTLRKAVHRLIISSSELREREYLTTKSYLWKTKNIL